MINTVFTWTFSHWYHTVLVLFIFFNFLYWGSALSARTLLTWMERKKMIISVENHQLYRGQIRTEISNSMLSIFVFSLQGILLQQGIRQGWFMISPEINWFCLIQILILFFWNEVHFYFVHRLMHAKWLIRRVHWVHHHSKEPTVFSTFSFHWVEAFALGTVIFFPLLVYPFQLPALISLPILSILLNTLGHCNYDLFPNASMHSLFKFSNRHSLHHHRGRGNYGFMLPLFDHLFRTRTASPKSQL